MQSHPYERTGLNDFQNLLMWIKSECSLSKSLALGLFLNTFLTGFLTIDTTPHRSYNIHIYDFCVAATAAIGVLLARNIVRTFDNIYVIFASWITIAIVSITMNAIGFHIKFGDPWPSDHIIRSALEVASLVGVATALTIALTVIARARTANRAVTLSRMQLHQREQQLADEIRRTSSDIEMNVQHRILPAVQRLIDQAEQQKKSVAIPNLTKNITSVIETIVLPLTWELQSDIEESSLKQSEGVASQSALTNRRVRKEIFRTSITSRLRATRQLHQLSTPNLTVGLFLLFGLPYGQYIFNFIGIIEILITAIFLWCLLEIILLRKVRIHGPNILMVLVIIVLTTASSTIFIVLADIFDGAASIPFAIPLTFLTLLLAIGTASAQSAFIGHQASIADAIQLNEKLSILVSELRQSSWNIKRKLARIVHGDVQSALIAASMRLSTATDNDEKTTEVVLGDLNEVILKLKGLNYARLVSFDEAETQLRGLWNDVMEVSFEISSATREKIESRESLFSCVVEFCREGIANAAKHAAAQQVHVVIREENEILVSIRISNKVNHSLNVESSGYGGHVFDQICHEWQFEIVVDQAELVGYFIL